MLHTLSKLFPVQSVIMQHQQNHGGPSGDVALANDNHCAHFVLDSGLTDAIVLFLLYVFASLRAPSTVRFATDGMTEDRDRSSGWRQQKHKGSECARSRQRT
jgi:hypothetical protein